MASFWFPEAGYSVPAPFPPSLSHWLPGSRLLCSAPAPDRANGVQENPGGDERDIKRVQGKPATPGEHAVKRAQENKDHPEESGYGSRIAAFIFHEYGLPLDDLSATGRSGLFPARAPEPPELAAGDETHRQQRPDEGLGADVGFQQQPVPGGHRVLRVFLAVAAVPGGEGDGNELSLGEREVLGAIGGNARALHDDTPDAVPVGALGGDAGGLGVAALEVLKTLGVQQREACGFCP